MEADDDGLYVVKFRAAGQGAKALVAEIIAGELARAAGLPVPEIVLVQLPDAFGSAEPDPEINELVTGSAGLNVGLDFLPGALDFSAGGPELVDPALAAQIVIFDAYTTNVDRTARNPNLLLWHGKLWLIDHGAALYQHHGTADLPARSADPFPMSADHVLLPLAGELAPAGAWLAQTLTPQVIAQTVALVPGELLGADPRAERAAYVDYLTRRLQEPRIWVTEAAAAQPLAVAANSSSAPARGPRDV